MSLKRRFGLRLDLAVQRLNFLSILLRHDALNIHFEVVITTASGIYAACHFFASLPPYNTYLYVLQIIVLWY